MRHRFKAVESLIHTSRKLQMDILDAALNLAGTELDLALSTPLIGSAPQLLCRCAALLESVGTVLEAAAERGLNVDGQQRRWAELCGRLAEAGCEPAAAGLPANA